MDSVKIWDECLDYLGTKIKRQSFLTWLKPTRGLPSNDSTLKVAVPNKFVAEWLEEHYSQLIQEAIQKTTSEKINLSFCVRNELGGHQTEISFNSKKEDMKLSSEQSAILNPKYTFESFVVGENNQFAHAASMAVAEAPGKTKFNPLYIYGGVGLGKTHLVQAIGHLVKEVSKEAKILYVTSEKFTNDFISSIGASTLQDFVHFYRSVDLLLLDDIQFFTGKESTQVQFFHTFNALYQDGKQIVLTSDRPPKEIKGLEERLLSRFQWGLVTDIQPPDLETRIAIIKKKTESDNIAIPDEIAVFLADNVTSNIRELEGSLIRLLAYCSLHQRNLTLDLAKDVLKDIIRNESKKISIEDIQKKVGEHFKLSPELLCSKRKTQEICWARQVAMYLCRNLTSFSLKTIGLKFGGRDHSTVIHSCNLVGENIKKDQEFKLKVDEIINSLYG
ncbi:MAG: chromosomal replication initiation protein [candidate division Zixibacteria bacterium SM23_73_2]|nr:MAG: chromosomal replication initiation protein [candidate division Zixibacteria bacterium SM23_73_2]